MNWSLRASCAAALLLLALGGCSHGSKKARKESTLCPESRGLWCLTPQECSFDRDRGCEVCSCSKPGASEEESGLPSGLPPDRRNDP
ncbi:hypothetical protein ACN28E_18385 [Archangium lansingense]|uniref:hypothetical protein n=1 Tax=Archangium lansingense TaxID=2995310 RepID=UPI003B81A1CB